MLKGCLVKIKKDIVADKYYHGYTTFPEGSLFTYEGLSDNGLKKVFSPVDVIEIEQPNRVFLDDHEFEVVEGCKTEMNSKELLFSKIKEVDKFNSTVNINRTSIFDLNSPTKLSPVTSLSIVTNDFTLTVSSNNKCSFSVTNNTDIFKSEFHSLDEDENIFKEVYEAIKHLLIIDV